MRELDITTASPLSENRRKHIESVFSEIEHDEISAAYHVDEAILGGIIVFDGERVFDGSIRTKLETVRNDMADDSK